MIIDDKQKIEKLIDLASEKINLLGEFPDNPFLTGNFKRNCLFTEYDHILNGDFFYEQLIQLCKLTNNKEFFFIDLDRFFFKKFNAIIFNILDSYGYIQDIIYKYGAVDNFIVFPTNLQWAIYTETCFGIGVITFETEAIKEKFKNIALEHSFCETKEDVTELLNYIGMKKNYSQKIMENF